LKKIAGKTSTILLFLEFYGNSEPVGPLDRSRIHDLRISGKEELFQLHFLKQLKKDTTLNLFYL